MAKNKIFVPVNDDEIAYPVSMKILLWVGRFTGQYPMSTSNVRCLSPFFMNYFNMAVVIFIVGLYCLCKTVAISVTFDLINDKNWDSATIAAEVCPEVIMPICSILQIFNFTCQTGHLQKCLKNILTLRKNLTHADKSTTYTYMSYSIKYIIAAPLTTIALLFVVEFSFIDWMIYMIQHGNWNVTKSSFYIIAKLFDFCSLLWPQFLFLLVGKYLLKMMAILKNNSKFYGKNWIERVREDYWNLTCIMKDLQKIMSLSFFYNFLNFFVHASFFAYSTSINTVVGGGRTMGDITLLLYAPTYVAFMWFVCSVASDLQDEFMSILDKIYTSSFGIKDDSHMSKVIQLETQISTNRPIFDAAGMFIVHKELMLTIIGTVVGYLIILFQFYSSDNHDRTYGYKSHSRNNTRQID